MADDEEVGRETEQNTDEPDETPSTHTEARASTRPEEEPTARSRESARRGRREDSSPEPDKLRAAFNFWAPVYANSVGIGGMPDQAKPEQRDGPLRDDELLVLLEHYTPPEKFDDAVEALAASRVVILVGPPGLGKRAGGVALIRELIETDIVEISPTITLRKLARFPYERDTGYLVPDRIAEERSADTDFTLRMICDNVHKAGAYLVMTSATVRESSEVVPQFDWAQPDLRRVLRAHCAERDLDEETIDHILDELADGCGMALFTSIAGRIAKGVEPDAALANMASTAVAEVRSWFTNHDSRRDIANVTTVAFTEGVSERLFETLRERLEAAIEQRIPTKAKRKAVKTDTVVMAGGREGRSESDSAEASLIRTDQVVDRSGNRRVPVFRKPGYRLRVLQELVGRFETPFWDAVSDWADDLVEAEIYDLTWGLALLADTDMEEVGGHYLTPWSAGSATWRGQIAAVYVLWGMCFNDATAPVALRTARRWARQGDPRQRWTAAMAFAGILGVSYPTVALSELWRLVLRSGDADVSRWVGHLFATLADNSDAGGKVLAHLDRQWSVATRPPTPEERETRSPQLRQLTLETLMHVLAARSPQTGQPSIAHYLHDNPDRADLIASLWGVVLSSGGHRTRAIYAMWSAISALRHVSHEPGEDGRVFAEAIARTLTQTQRQSLYQHLVIVDARRRQRSGRSRTTGAVLLSVLEHLRSLDIPRSANDSAVPDHRRPRAAGGTESGSSQTT